jgi:hypothetical protein
MNKLSENRKNKFKPVYVSDREIYESPKITKVFHFQKKRWIKKMRS